MSESTSDTASNTVSFGYENVSPEEKTRRVGEVFSSVAKKYDIMNDAMSFGMHRGWKDRFVKRVKPQAGENILDMAGGTGDIAFRMADRGANITVADINQEMLDVGAERAIERDEAEGAGSLVFSQQNAEEVSFASNSFDAYTIVFGIRNVTHKEKALKEALRVLRPGGRFYCMEFSVTDWSGFREIYDLYSMHIMPRMGQVIAGDTESYRYLAESIRKFPRAPQFEAMIRDAGFVNTKAEIILGGAVAIHSGWKV
ncbi:ubiquinone biosynthesis methyltransferase UbiE [Erythrobacter longus]|uniref:Ubiquinone/menaquinone biosynthesis C-methyltransferase UbiE n=1 Tax=Erythrobacter longus TaxID=1044 RepID=A0A074M9S0_ERYLO|nr:class I SAM-dependent methyltransferase [Erythrobacter longus]KEO88563.1 ubiquinone biosynthesis methyltransferase UbiE [Erythrobacter longus]